MGRIAKLDLIEGGVEEFAAAWIEGATRAELGKAFGCSKETVTNWTQRDDVKITAGKLIRERALKIKRKSDAKIMEALNGLDPVDDIDSILKIRREFAAERIPDGELSDSELMELAFAALDENPELAKAMKDAQEDSEPVEA